MEQYELEKTEMAPTRSEQILARLEKIVEVSRSHSQRFETKANVMSQIDKPPEDTAKADPQRPEGFLNRVEDYLDSLDFILSNNDKTLGHLDRLV